MCSPISAHPNKPQPGIKLDHLLLAIVCACCLCNIDPPTFQHGRYHVCWTFNEHDGILGHFIRLAKSLHFSLWDFEKKSRLNTKIGTTNYSYIVD